MKDQLLWDLSFHISVLLSRFPRAVLCINDIEGGPTHHYTVGNQRKGLPELLLIGNLAGAEGILHILSDKLLELNKPFGHGDRIILPSGSLVQMWDTCDTAKSDYTFQAGQYFETDDYTVQQVVFSDPSGRFPEDPECHPICKVPVLKKFHLHS